MRVCVRAKQFLCIKILITGSALSSLGSKRRPSQRQWASRYILPFDGGGGGGGDQRGTKGQSGRRDEEGGEKEGNPVEGTRGGWKRPLNGGRTPGED